ncbi:MAG: hypothetical protein K5682_10845 [Lachnospiraceae bacterium]|nr:hypothetical protein [Lachnospiraceae bacterium]
MFDVPVVVICFNRINEVRKLMAVLQEVKPRELFVISDGPRPNVPDEKEKVDKVRSFVENPNWDCVVHKDYANENMGCDQRVTSGLDKVFSVVDRAIIFEDDCIPDRSFFPYCQELLDRYTDEDRVKYIAGSNQIDTFPIEESYIFTINGWTLGWATWARAWNRRIDLDREWSGIKPLLMRYKRYSLYERYQLCKTIDLYHKRGMIPWDFTFTTSVLLQDGFSIVPRSNLVVHIGFNEDATHVSEAFPGYRAETVPMEFPLIHPSEIREKKGYHRAAYLWHRETIPQKLVSPAFYKRQIKRLLKR